MSSLSEDCVPFEDAVHKWETSKSYLSPVEVTLDTFTFWASTMKSALPPSAQTPENMTGPFATHLFETARRVGKACEAVPEKEREHGPWTLRYWVERDGDGKEEGNGDGRTTDEGSSVKLTMHFSGLGERPASSKWCPFVKGESEPLIWPRTSATQTGDISSSDHEPSTSNMHAYVGEEEEPERASTRSSHRRSERHAGSAPERASTRSSHKVSEEHAGTATERASTGSSHTHRSATSADKGSAGRTGTTKRKSKHGDERYSRRK